MALRDGDPALGRLSDDHRAMPDELVGTALGDDGYEVVAGVDDEPETDEE